MDYAELLCRSNLSFLHGASHPHELVERAHALGYRALAITDEASLSGVVQAHVAATAIGMPLLIGAQFMSPELPGRLALIATSRTGYAALSGLITQTRRREVKGHYRLTLADLDAGVPHCIAIWLPNPSSTLAAQHQTARWIKSVFGERAYLGANLLLRGNDQHWQEQLQILGATQRINIVAVGDVVMHRRARKPLADTLTAIRHGLPLSACGRRFSPNAEQYLRTRLRLARIYPAAQLAATVEIADRCNFSLDELRYEYPEEIVPPGLTPTQWLRHLTEQGAQQRFPQGLPARVRQQIEHELSLIHELHYEPYFLTVYDIVEIGRAHV